jgi:hypothetical protein
MRRLREPCADRLKKSIDSGCARAVRPACQHAYGPPSGGHRGWDRRCAPMFFQPLTAPRGGIIRRIGESANRQVCQSAVQPIGEAADRRSAAPASESRREPAEGLRPRLRTPWSPKWRRAFPREPRVRLFA